MPSINRTEKTDTATDSVIEITPAAVDHDGESFEPGEPCGVCRFPMGPGQICGNVVYASHEKGALPKYCGQEGQSVWQAKRGTEGDPRHQSSLAGYPRKQAKMTAADAGRLAEEEAARRGIGRRRKSSAPETPAAAAPAAASVEPVTAAPEEEAPESAIASLAALVAQLPGRIATVRGEIEQAYADRDAIVAEVMAEREQLAAEIEAERDALAKDRAAAQAARERAETEIRTATDAKLQTEGELRSAQKRIEELERELAEQKSRHRAEIEEVRRTEYDRFREMMRDFAATIQKPEPEPRIATVPTEPTEEAQAAMLKRVGAGSVTFIDGEWFQSNAKANAAAVVTLNHLREAGKIEVAANGQALRA